jgi:3-oxoacyl-[acyl-carrier protein] reductase
MPQELPVALVTGASRGIGRAIAAALARAGHHVVVNYRSREREARETVDAINRDGGSAEPKPFDVADAAACDKAIQECLATRGRIDVLVNNAGVRNDMLMVWMTPEDWNRVLATNLTGFYNVTRPVVKEMLLKRRGRIVSIASTAGQAGMAGQVNYAAAKAGLIGASKALALETAKRGVTVNVVAPGFIETEMLEGLDRERTREAIPLRRFGTPDEVAAAVLFLCSEGAAYITGAVINVNGGVYL